MKVTNLKHESSSVNNIVLNSDGSVGGELATTLASKLDLAGGKILQIVRATDGTARSTTSSSYVDVTGMSVTITPSQSNSIILLVSTFGAQPTDLTSAFNMFVQITDSSNNPISGAEDSMINETANIVPVALIGYATPATTSAVTYKLRFRSQASGTAVTIRNANSTGQLYAIEVSA